MITRLLKSYPGTTDVIKGTIKMPTHPGALATPEIIDKFKKESNHFEVLDNTAQLVLSANMTEDMLQKVMRFSTAKDMWDELARLYDGATEDKSYDLCMKFFSYQKDPEHDMTTHISAVKSLFYDLNTELEGNDLPVILIICKILDTLPEQFFAFKSSWLLMGKQDRNIENLTIQLCAYERALINKAECSTNVKALVVKSEKSKNNFKKKELKCKYCGQVGHIVKKCHKWISDGRPPKNSTSSVNNMNLTVLSVEDTTEADKNSWYVDNGATSHVTNRSDLFKSFEYFQNNHTVTTASGQTINAIGKGTIRLDADVNGRVEPLLLKDVWYIPALQRNLFSVLAAQDKLQNSTFESRTESCTLKVNGKEIVNGKRKKLGGLYMLNVKIVIPKQEVNVVTNSQSLQLYHERLGHQNKKHVKKIVEKEFDIKLEYNTELCEGCINGKLHRLKFGTRERATKPGELIHSDVCGPFMHSISKFRYFVLFKDDYSRYRHVYFMKHKSEVHSKLKQFLAEIRTAGHVVQEFLSDNGGEFDNEQICNTFRQNGIKQRFTMPYTPEQNGCSERDNRTIVETARAIMHAHEEIPQGLWAELINTSVYILNRTGPTTVEGKSPFELFYGKKPSIKHLRIIGSTCYAHVPKQRRKKLCKKAEKGILIGYDGDDGYRIWSKENYGLIRSRDVFFDERPLIEKPIVQTSVEARKVDKNSFDIPIPSVEPETQPIIPEEASQMAHDQETVESNVPIDPINDSVNFDTAESDSDVEDTSSNGSILPHRDTDLQNESRDDILREDVQTQEASQEDLHFDQLREQVPHRMTLRDRSTIKPPGRFDEFVLNCVEKVYDYEEEPKTFKHAMKSVDKNKWRNAMDDEISSLKDNETWDLMLLPKGRKAISTKWVYKIKRNSNGNIEKYKARLVAVGYSQKKGVDYEKTFSPVAKMSSIRTLLSIAARDSMILAQFDVSTAFLYGSLNEEIYVKQPEGYNDGTSKVCKLKRSLYGLKQAPLCWNNCIKAFLLKQGFKPGEDPCIFSMKKGEGRLLLALYVDDGMIAGTKGAYTKKVLEKFCMQNSKAAATPIVKDSELREDAGGDNSFPHREAVGALAYLMVGTRPDIAYALSVASRHLEAPTKRDIAKVKRIFRYLNGTRDYCITYRKDMQKNLVCYSDADHGGDPDTGRSTSGLVCVYGGPISWRSKLQTSVAISSTEAEIVAASEAAREIIWLKRLIENIEQSTMTPVLYVDNESAIKLALNPPYEFHNRTKHIKLRHFFIRETIADGTMMIAKIGTENQIADMFTKPLYKPRLAMLCRQIGVHI